MSIADSATDSGSRSGRHDPGRTQEGYRPPRRRREGEQDATLGTQSLQGTGRAPAGSRRGAFHDPEQLMEVALDQIGLLHRLAALLAEHPDDAADLVMETYVWASRNHESYRDQEITLRAWLLKALLRIARVRGRWLDGPRAGPEADRVRGQLSDLDGAAADTRLKRALDRLLPVHRMLLLLWSVGRLSYREMSSVLNLNTDTVMRHLHYAREFLRRQLAGPGPGSDRLRIELEDTFARSEPDRSPQSAKARAAERTGGLHS